MRVLIITRSPWEKDNSIGNTLYDFFSDFKEAKIYSLCLREAPKVCDIPIKNYYISEHQIVKNLFRGKNIGKITDGKDNNDGAKTEQKVYTKAKQIRSTIPHIIREVIWSFGTWKNDQMDSFLKDVSPDIVFFPVFPCAYAHKVLEYIKNKTGAKIVIFHADDCYSLKQITISPLSFLYRLYVRRWVRKTVGVSDLQYVISDVQKEDYDKAFGITHKVLTKFADFTGTPSLKHVYSEPLQAVFTGNISVNRWKSLSFIANAFETINKNGLRIQLRIFTATPITGKIEKHLNRGNSSFLMGKVESEKIPEIQNDADILVHVEAFDLKNRLLVRQSFSTKIVDYMKRGRAILAVGPREVASIKHLIETKSAIVASKEQELIDEVKSVLDDHEKMNQIAINAYECGRNHHNKNTMLGMLHHDLLRLAGELD